MIKNLPKVSGWYWRHSLTWGYDFKYPVMVFMDYSEWGEKFAECSATVCPGSRGPYVTERNNLQKMMDTIDDLRLQVKHMIEVIE